MSSFLHHIPGRVRLRCPAIRHDTHGAEALARALESLDGIETVEANPVSANVLIRFDAARLSADSLPELVQQCGVRVAAAPRSLTESGIAVAPAAGPGTERAGEVGRNVGKFVAGVAVEKMLERSMVALIGAIL